MKIDQGSHILRILNTKLWLLTIKNTGSMKTITKHKDKVWWIHIYIYIYYMPKYKPIKM